VVMARAGAAAQVARASARMVRASAAGRCYDFSVVTALLRFSSIWTCCAILLGLARPAAAAPTRKVLIETVPAGASVYVGEKESGASGVTPVTLELPVGENVVIIELDNYVPKFETVMVPKGKGKAIKVSYKLEAAGGVIVVSADAGAKGAKVLVDDEERGLAPLRIDVPAGSHRIEVVAKGKTIFLDTVDVTAGGEALVNAKGGKVAAAGGKDSKDGKGKGGKDGKGKDGKDGGKVAIKAEEVRSGELEPPVGGREPIDDEEPVIEAPPTEVAAIEQEPEPDPAPTKLEVRAREREPKAPARRWLKVSPLVELGYRYLDYTAIQSAELLPALEQRGNVLFGLRVEAQPLGSLPGLTISAAGGHSLPQDLGTSRGEARSLWWRGELELSYRLRLGKSWSILALGGYALARYSFDGPGPAEAILPVATYSVVRLGAGVGYRRDWLELIAQVENRPVLGGGVMADRFRSASADGLAARLGAMVMLGDRLFARLEGNYARYAWTFDYDMDDTYRAKGATDVHLGVSFATGAAF
jgi:PEGA domain